MAINWHENREPKPADNQTDSVGPAVKAMIERSMPQVVADHKRLQADRAAEAKRLRQESIDAAKLLTTFNRNGH